MQGVARHCKALPETVPGDCIYTVTRHWPMGYFSLRGVGEGGRGGKRGRRVERVGEGGRGWKREKEKEEER